MIYTIGHSTRTFEEFLELLKAHGIDRVVDVRTVPGSKRVPQFNRESITKRLAGAGIGYTHMKGLGGWRKPRKDSPNTAWRNESFRGFADYMQSEEFEENLAGLIALSKDQQIALMCAEAVPWRCHRSLIADALSTRGIEVRHITGPGEAKPHEMTDFAKVEGTKVTYPGGK
jgi:uncharacterized protein (DUF488 family)